MIDQITKWLFFLSIFAACIAGAFGFGLTVGHYQIWPNAEIRNLQNNLISLIRFQEFVPDGRRMAAPVGAKAERHFILNPSAAQQDGYFAILGWSDQASRYQVWLYGADGELVHSWPIDDLSLSDVAKSRSNAPHALRLLKDGSVIFNFDRLGELHRLDACGGAIWSISKAYHHSLAPSQDGTFWIWAGREEVGDDYQYMVRIDPETGHERERIGLIEQVFEQSAAQATALSLQSGFPIATNSDDALDRFHPNDVEELMPEMAGAFPQFAAGDLLVSLRNLNMVAVIGRSGEIKWAAYGPWHQQHDPDFNADGTISIFDNNRGRGPSRIISIVPDETISLPQPLAAPEFASDFRGKHQRLPNGALLIVIPEEGRVIEVAQNGEVLREINNLSERAGFHEDVANAYWLPADHFDQLPLCQK